MLEDRKYIQIISKEGGQIGLLTRAPKDEIRKELRDSTTEWISMSALTPEEQPIDFELKRDQLVGFFIGPVPKQQTRSNLALPTGVKLQ